MNFSLYANVVPETATSAVENMDHLPYPKTSIKGSLTTLALSARSSALLLATPLEYSYYAFRAIRMNRPCKHKPLRSPHY